MKTPGKKNTKHRNLSCEIFNSGSENNRTRVGLKDPWKNPISFQAVTWD